jgi:predicted nucleic acid-binding protein
MRLVADASAFVEWLLRTPRGTSYGQALHSHELHAPALCDVEVTSALRRALLARTMTVHRVEQALDAYRDLRLIRHGHLALLRAAGSMRDNFSAYDACYVALAHRLDAAFLTADASLARATARHTSVALLDA